MRYDSQGLSRPLIDTGEEDAYDPKCEARWWAQVVALNVLWMSSSTSVVMMLKRTVSAVGDEAAIFPFSFAFTTIVQPIAGLLVWFLSTFIMDRQQAPVPPLSWTDTAKWLAVGLLNGVEIGLGNKSFEFINVADSTMIKATGVLFVMLNAFLWGIEGMGWLRVASGLLLVSGAFVQGLGNQGDGQTASSKSYAIGAAMLVVTMTLSAQRWVLTQWIFRVERQRKSALGQLSKPQLMMRVLPIIGLVTLPMAVIFEPVAFTSETIWQKKLYLRALAVALGVATLLFAELNLVHRLSAVGFTVNAGIHQIPTVFAGVIIDHNPVSPISALGFAFCIAGTLVYAAARYRESMTKASS